MRDRIPGQGKANRIAIALDNGERIEGVLSFADDAAQDGSAYSKGNVLPDTLCDMLGIDRAESEPKDAFKALRTYTQQRESTFQKLMTGRFI